MWCVRFCDSGEDVSRRRREGVPWYWWVILAILFLLMLKTFGVLPDPSEYFEIAASIGTATLIIGLFAYQINQIHQFQGRLSIAETKIDNIERDLSEIKGGLQQVRDMVNQIKGQLGEISRRIMEIEEERHDEVMSMIRSLRFG